MGSVRKIVRIDEEKCDGCGLCAQACAEGAIQIIGGKARLVSETYCDGLGACLGECPQGAITIEERAAAAFDEKAVEQHLAVQGKAPATVEPTPRPAPQPSPRPAVASMQGHVCPGSMAQMLRQRPPAAAGAPSSDPASEPTPQLANWPLQICLVPVQAPYFEGADLLISADCVPFAYANFHQKLLAGKVLLIGCPKLDDTDFYREKLTEIFRQNNIRSVEVAYMEVPCCFGLVQLVRFALADVVKDIPLTLTKIGIRGAVCETRTLAGSESPVRAASH